MRKITVAATALTLALAAALPVMASGKKDDKAVLKVGATPVAPRLTQVSTP